MIKSTKAKEKCIPMGFPKLMINNTTDVIVLFTSFTVGVVVYESTNKDTKVFNIGYHSMNWDTDNFVDYNEGLTLKNI